MSALVCGKCGGLTNTAVCDWEYSRSESKFVIAECYARFEAGKWVKGCGYANCNAYTIGGVDRLLANSDKEKS